MKQFDVFAITHPPYFKYLPAFLGTFKASSESSDVTLYVYSSQTTPAQKRILEELVGELHISARITSTPEPSTIGQSRNRIFAQGTQPWAVFMDTDVCIHPNYFNELEKVITTYGKEADAFAGGIGVSQATRFGCYEGLMDIMIYFKNLKLENSHEYLDIMKTIDFERFLADGNIPHLNDRIKHATKKYEGTSSRCLQGFNQIIRRETFDQVNGFDESFWSAEDREMGIKLNERAKKIIFAPSVIVGHNYSFSLSEIAQRKRIHGFWYGELRRKYPDSSHLPRMSAMRWFRNAAKCINPPSPFNTDLAGRLYYALSFFMYAVCAIASEHGNYNPLKKENQGWTYNRDK